MVKELQANYYRFSISWTRLLPSGADEKVNEYGLQYYNEMIDYLIKNDIKPWVTMYHWDLPQELQALGGWPNPDLVEYFANYSRILFESFGDRVKTWITFSDPVAICRGGYGIAKYAPGIDSSGVEDYNCAYTILKAHAAAYHLYTKEFKPKQKGELGITLESYFFISASDTVGDKEATTRAFAFYLGMFANPIFGTGDYPPIVKAMVANASTSQGYNTSRLPEFTPEEITNIRKSSDFFGLNYYSSVRASNHQRATGISWDADSKTNLFSDLSWPPTSLSSVRVVPQGLKALLKHIKDTYGNIKIYITENGCPNKGGTDDYDRINYILVHLSYLLDAIYEEEVNVAAYTAWSLIDSFEWSSGYTTTFGLHHVDFEADRKPRTEKMSAKIYGKVIRNKKLPETTVVPGSSRKYVYNSFTLFIIVLLHILPD